jgi:ADP-heptose:LPS heptosyltransferase
MRHVIVPLAFSLLKRRATEYTSVSKTVVIYKVDRIGDLVLASKAITTLVRHYRSTGLDVVVIVSDLVADLARHLFPEATIISIPPFHKWLRPVSPLSILGQWRKLASLNARVLICLRHQRNTAHQLVLSWIRASKIIGIRNCGEAIGVPSSPTGLDFPNPIEPPAAPSESNPTELELHRLVVQQATGLQISETEIIPKLKNPHPRRHEVLICPFSSSPMRDYPRDKIAEALAFVSSRKNIRISLMGSRDQTSRLADLQKYLEESGKYGVITVTPDAISAMLEEIGGARLVVSMETASAHMACAMDRPAVLLVGGGHYRLFAPWARSKNQKWLSNRLDCYNCNWVCSRKAVECITEIRPQAVADAILQLMEVSPK